jgi:outer membrane protein OmpA-like peptidoglycan-associated protein
MRCTYHLLFAAAIVAAPMPVAAQVTVDLNALNGLGGAPLPAPPPSAPLAGTRYHRRTHHFAPRTAVSAEREAPHAAASAVAAATPTPAGPETIEHPTNLGPSFTSLPALPGAVPPLPPKPKAVETALAPPQPKAAETASAPPEPKLAETASAPPKPAPAPKPVSATAAAAPAAPTLALPSAVPPPPAAPGRLAEAAPAPPAAQVAPPPQPAKAQQPNDALPKGADRLTLPFFVQESDLPPAEGAMLRDFAQRYGAGAEYVVRAFATPPVGDDDPSTPRRIALARAQSVAAALTHSGVQPDRVRLLALGNAGGTPADRVEVIAMPPSSGHTSSDSSP